MPIAPIVMSSTDVADLDLDESQLTPVGAAVLSAAIDVPPGEWLVWPGERRALWIGRRFDALPPVVRARLDAGASIDVAAALSQLADIGVWLREAAVLTLGTWSPSRRSGDLFRPSEASEASALSGIFVDRDGQSIRLEITGGGVWWAERPSVAIQWILAVYRLAIPE